MTAANGKPEPIWIASAADGAARAPDVAARMAALFMVSFPHSVRDMFGDRPGSPRAMTDFYTFIVRAEPEAVQLAWESRETAPEDGHGCAPSGLPGARGPQDRAPARLIGYAITPRSMLRLWARAALTFVWFPWVARFLAGGYGVGLSAIPRVFRSKLAFAQSFRPENDAVAQVLSVAVNPAWRGRSVGRALLERGLDYLRRQGVARVKLEVLDDNAPARHLYQTMGFRPAGEVPYGPRRWIIMIKDLA